jgi:hypothetical protein
MSNTILLDPKVVADQARDEMIATDPLFTMVPVISADPGDLVTEINAALQAIGLGVLVLPATFRATKPNMAVPIPGTSLRGPFFDKVRLVVQVLENSAVWRAPTNPLYPNQPTAQNVAMLVSAALHWFAPAGINERFICNSVDWIRDTDDSGLNIWHIEFSAGGGIAYNKGRVAPVLFSYDDDAQSVILTCATLGAAIWYVTGNNQGYPSPANPNAQLAQLTNFGVLLNEDGTPRRNEDGSLAMNENGTASIGIPLSPGQTIYARAWMSGLNPQNAPNDQQLFTAP